MGIPTELGQAQRTEKSIAIMGIMSVRRTLVDEQQEAFLSVLTRPGAF